MKVWLGKDIQMKRAAEGVCIPLVKGTADAIQDPFYKALARNTGPTIRASGCCKKAALSW